MKKLTKKSVLSFVFFALIFSSCEFSTSSKNTDSDSDNSQNGESQTENSEQENTENDLGGGEEENSDYWTDVTSLKSAFVDGGYFDYFGLATTLEEANAETSTGTAKDGIKYHANSITMGNEMKPDFVFNWPYPTWKDKIAGSSPVYFTASNGQKIQVLPELSGLENNVGTSLKLAKEIGVKIRGHVLVWHSQTPDSFFTKDYSETVITDSDGVPTNLASKEVMKARQEWYIKTVLDYVSEWEKTYNNGEHIVYCWDVVNEAAADGATKSNDTMENYLRGSIDSQKNKSPSEGGSRWYQIYGDSSYIVDAFRFANAYAPDDVLLGYNDYNCYIDYSESYKTSAICKIIDDIQSGDAETVNEKSVKPRIDFIGMQSHVGMTFPEVSAYENTVKKFLEKEIDVQVTEFDVATGESYDTTGQELKELYKEYFKMFLDNRKIYGKNGISLVTVWGITDETSWIRNSNKYTQYPLLFDENYNAKPCFYGVLEALEEYKAKNQ